MSIIDQCMQTSGGKSTKIYAQHSPSFTEIYLHSLLITINICLSISISLCLTHLSFVAVFLLYVAPVSSVGAVGQFEASDKHDLVPVFTPLQDDCSDPMGKTKVQC